MDIRKRGRPEPGFSLNGGFKKSKQGLIFSILALPVSTISLRFGFCLFFFLFSSFVFVNVNRSHSSFIKLLLVISLKKLTQHYYGMVLIEEGIFSLTLMNIATSVVELFQ